MAKSSKGLTRKQMQKKNYFSSKEKSDNKSDGTSSSKHHERSEIHHSSKAKGHDDSSYEGHKAKKRNIFRAIYEDRYKQIMLIPVLMLVISLGMIGFRIATTGDAMEFGVSITGGISITIEDVSDFDASEVQQEILSRFPDADVEVRRLESPDEIGVNVEASRIGGEEMLSMMEDIFGEFSDYSLEETGSTLGDAFFRQSIIALLFAFLLMGGVIFLSFRTFVPSAAVILSALFDIIVSMAIINMLGMRVTTAGLAAFLMLIGYSVDTDVLMSSKLLKSNRSSRLDSLYDAMKTGLMMAFTTIAVLIVGINVSNSEVLIQIMTIVLVGLLVDLLSTWIQNAGMMRWYLEKKDSQ